jgi:hypothetical protein
VCFAFASFAQTHTQVARDHVGKRDAHLLRTGQFTYSVTGRGKHMSTGEVGIHRVAWTDVYVFRAEWTGEFRPQQWKSVATSDFVPIFANLSSGEGTYLRPSFELKYGASQVSGTTFSRKPPGTAHTLDATVPVNTVDQRIDWAAVLSGDLEPGRGFQFNVYDPDSGVSRVVGQVGPMEQVQIPAGSFVAYRVSYRMEKSGRVEKYEMLATGGQNRMMLREKFPDGSVSELTRVQDDAGGGENFVLQLYSIPSPCQKRLIPIEVLNYFAGDWTGKDAFTSGRAPASELSFTPVPKNSPFYVDIGNSHRHFLWCVDSASGDLVMFLASNHAGGARVYRSQGWQNGELVFQSIPEFRASFPLERFTFKRESGEVFQTTYEMSLDDGKTWMVGDRQTFTRRSSH